MIQFPRVTIICLCYNQARFVEEALRSAISQEYSNLQVIVVDDASTDNSADVIRKYITQYPEVRFIALPENVGNCRAFNIALAEADGKYVIDLAADDVLFPQRVSTAVSELERRGDTYGVSFSDAEWIDENGRRLFLHSDRFPHETIPQGDIYRQVIRRFFICSPSMVMARKVLDHLGGYDERLSYEDFDFWIRSSREFLYCYTPQPLVRKRIVKGSMSQKQFSFLNPQQRSTFKVCEKIFSLNRDASERDALERRIFYEMRMCLRLLDVPLFLRYVRLYLRNRTVAYSQP